MSAVPTLTLEEEESIALLSKSMNTIGNMFINDEGDPALLRVGVEIIRESADVLEVLADRWESDVQDR